MAITVTASNHLKYQMMLGNVNLDTDDLKIILMNSAFTFDPDSHATLSDVTASQLSTGNGYTQNDESLTSTTITENDTTNQAEFTCDDVTFTGSGGSIGPTGSYVVYSDTSSDDTVLFCCDFGTDYTIDDGSSLQLQNIKINLA
jgi:hypothetical protein